MGVLGDLPDQGPPIGLRHPVLRLDLVVRRTMRFKPGKTLRVFNDDGPFVLLVERLGVHRFLPSNPSDTENKHFL